jgi:hypothetical protein
MIISNSRSFADATTIMWLSLSGKGDVSESVTMVYSDHAAIYVSCERRGYRLLATVPRSDYGQPCFEQGPAVKLE